MRALAVACTLFTLISGPLSGQEPSPRFLKVDILGKSALCTGKTDNGPSEVHMRMPLSLAKGLLGMASQGRVKVNGKVHKDLDVDQLVKLLEKAKSGDLLLELTTDKGDLVRVTLE